MKAISPIENDYLAGVAFCNLVKIRGFQNLTESLPVFAGLFVKFQAVFDDFQYLPFTVNSRQLFCQTGMPTEFTPQLYPETFGALNNRAGRANLHAPAAAQAPGVIDLRAFSFTVQGNRIFFAGFNACFTLRAGFGG